MLQALVPQLRQRFGETASQCGADSAAKSACEGASTDLLVAVLEEARVEYSMHSPTTKIFTVIMNDLNPVITLEEEPFAVTAVYISSSQYQTGLEFPSDFFNVRPYFMPGSSYDPALARVEHMYQDYTTEEASFIRNDNQIRITSSFSFGSKVEIYVSTMRNWNEVPEWGKPTIVKLALIKLIDRVTTSSEGLMRIPTPSGYFEFDGGRVMQNLRTKLADETYTTLKSRTHALKTG